MRRPVALAATAAAVAVALVACAGDDDASSESTSPSTAPPSDHQPVDVQIDPDERAAAMLATAGFQDVATAEAAGYATSLDALGCFQDAERGGMGVHYVNDALMDDHVDITNPEALVYEALAMIPPDIVGIGTPLARIGPLVITGLIRARRGEADVWAALDEADELARHSDELQWIAPVTAARLEAASLDGTSGDWARVAARVLRACIDHRAGWWAGEVAWWGRGFGVDDGVPPGAPKPWALLLAGRARASAAAWARLGCPYEQGVALAASDDPDDLRSAFERFDVLGARPAAAATTRRMRALGVTAVPRGVRQATRDNPAGLTPREMDVLRLLAQGLRNSEIASDLVVSPKTVDHHVSAVLRKLGVNNRRSAARTAAVLGIDTAQPAGR